MTYDGNINTLFEMTSTHTVLHVLIVMSCTCISSQSSDSEKHSSAMAIGR